jgi:imidazolonepropionase-like amidohydrolase
VELFGMSNAEALICATRNGGAAFDPRGNVGTLTEDSVADLLLVSGDPLTDIRILQDRAKLKVMKDGRWC